MPSVDQILEDIAVRHLHVETLATRNSDSADFHDTAVWSMKAALLAAFEAGRQAAVPTRRRTVRDCDEWYLAFHDRHAEGGSDFVRCTASEMREYIAKPSAPSVGRFLARCDVAKAIFAHGLSPEDVKVGKAR